MAPDRADLLPTHALPDPLPAQDPVLGHELGTALCDHAVGDWGSLAVDLAAENAEESERADQHEHQDDPELPCTIHDPSRLLALARKGPREQDVVLEVDVVHQVDLERCQRTVELAPARTGVLGHV